MKNLFCKKSVTSLKSTEKNGGKKIGQWINKYSQYLVLALVVVFMLSNIVFASSAETMWNAVMNLITTWVTRFGLLVVLIGGIMFALGFKNDDPDGKTRGANTMIAGGFITGVVGLVSYLLI